MSISNLAPGINFYHYVNHVWLCNPLNQIPPDYSSWGGFTKLYDEGLINQINIVKSLENKCLSEEQEKVFSIWKASETRFSSWTDGTSNCSPISQELKILDEYFLGDHYIQNLAKYLHYTQINGISNVIDFDSGSDLKNVNHVVLDFSISGLSLPSREYYKSPDFQEKLTAYKQHLTNVKNEHVFTR